MTRLRNMNHLSSFNGGLWQSDSHYRPLPQMVKETNPLRLWYRPFFCNRQEGLWEIPGRGVREVDCYRVMMWMS